VLGTIAKLIRGQKKRNFSFGGWGQRAISFLFKKIAMQYKHSFKGLFKKGTAKPFWEVCSNQEAF
jgi:hypothetical protein